MKYCISILMIVLFAQTSNAQNNHYNDLWKKVDKFENDGLPKSALDIVKQIETRAKQDKNVPQQIKTLLYKSKYAMTLEEDAQLKIMADFKNAISQSESPTKNVLENMLATLYWQYFQQNRWKFYDRTNTAAKVDSTDFQSWDLKTLFDEVHLLYQKSLENGLVLQQTKLDGYSDILLEQKNSKTFRPTLFDLLAHTALEFYKTDENSITQPAYKFLIDDPEYLSDAETFSKMNISSQDSVSLQLHALKLYQKLTEFHLKDAEPDAAVDVDIQRLDFVKSNATFEDKDSRLLKTLKASSQHYKNKAISALYDFEIASLYHEQGQAYQSSTSKDNRWKIKEALDLCNATITKYPKSNGAIKCEVLKQNILQPSLQLKSENFLPIQQEGLLRIDYKNLTQLAFKIYHISESELNHFKKLYRDDQQLAFIKKLDVKTSFETTLKDESDYQNHSVEAIIPKLENGHYLIFVSPKGMDDQLFAFKNIQVTNIALLNSSSGQEERFQLLDRNNGKPLANAKVKLSYKKNYNGSTISENKTTDSNGEFTINKDTNRLIDLRIEAIYTGDTGIFDNYYVNPYYGKQTKQTVQHNAFLFTDRSIYRPGQVVYFKGIAMSTDNGKSQVTPNLESKVVLYNVNREVIKELKVKTNEFGSVAGEFILPSDGLTGRFTIEFFAGVTAATYLSVEEYKRPKFETKFEPVTETFKVNDSIAVKGTALAYAGSNITDAKVVYRVSRQVNYPIWYYWKRPWFQNDPQEIVHGEALTNDKGEFEIIFKAIPDESVDKKGLPVFQYEITADVTDINGETRSATTIVNVGYHALLATIDLASKLDKGSKDHKLTINTKNLNGEFVPASGTVKIYKLKAPSSVFRPRPWEVPDYKSISEDEFRQRFPHIAYNNESNPETWDKGEVVFESTFDTSKSKELSLGNINKWPSGQYVAVLESKDKFGQEVKDETRTLVFDDNDKTVPDRQLFTVTTNKASYAPNDNVLITFGSAANITVTVVVEKDQKTVNTYLVPLDNSKKTIAVPVSKEDMGGFVIHYSYAAFNHFGSGTETISVPYPSTDLEIETLTFRDKLLPGTDETWSFKIKGPKGDKVSAELLASMYDRSLDQFKAHDWSFSPIYKPLYSSYSVRNAGRSFGINSFNVHSNLNGYVSFPYQGYDQLNWFGFYFGYGRMYMARGKASGIIANAAPMVSEDKAVMEEAEENADAMNVALSVKREANALGYNSHQNNALDAQMEEKESLGNVAVRKNLQETAFFFPQLQTDAEGSVSFSFTTPEALTSWKLQLLAHTKNLESATTSLETVTQKELMVIPNAPRFLRHGDQISISTKIANLTDKQLSGSAQLILTDAFTGNDISQILVKSSAVEAFTVDANGNTQASWRLTIPEDINAVQYKIVARAGDFSDGEQNALPVLSNRMLVTETLPMWVRSNETRTFTLDKLKTNSSTTLRNHKLTLEITSNPAWYAVQSLPYLMEYPYDCNEQTFSRYYANALASHIANSNPRIQEVFNQWKNTDALLSNLEKNEELKNILIQETPWLRDAQSETEQKKRIALLFDMNKMNNELASAKRKLQNNQMGNGAWSWFDGGPSNRYITQHIIAGFGHLKHLNVTSSTDETSQMVQKAIEYLDAEFVKEYKALKKYDKNVDLAKDHLSHTQLHYLYMRSFFPEIEKSKEVKTITDYYHTQIQKYWLSRPLYAKGLMALVSYRAKDNTMADKILKSLKETSVTNDELGMYWKDNKASWFWYQAPIETQALMIEAFGEIKNDVTTIDNLKIWLLKNKQTNSWSTTKSTTEAVYALLLQGSDWLSVTDAVEVLVGGQKIEPSNLENVKAEAGTGYFKTAWNDNDVKPNMATVQMTKKGDGIAWGALYWQYFEDLDKITSAETPLSLKKKLFLKTNTDRGEQISEVTADTDLNVGDLVRVRIELRSDRNMEFLHMKDMRAAGFEPVNVISQYKWQDGLGYYESTKDAATNFFFDYLPKGTYVFEYDLRVNNAGNMSNGITTIQSMYAPEFSSHSEGVRVTVSDGR